MVLAGAKPWNSPPRNSIPKRNVFKDRIVLSCTEIAPLSAPKNIFKIQRLGILNPE
jgi:hypothetical protein